MRVAFITGYFPVLSETFILDQLTGLIDRGVDVDVFGIKPECQTKIHSDFHMYNIKDRLKCPDLKLSSRFDRVIKFPGLFFSNISSNPQLIFQSLNLIKYGKVAFSLSLFHEVIPFLRKKKYDIIHAHFGPFGNKALMLRDLNAIDGKLITSFHGYDLSTYLRSSDDKIYARLFSEGEMFLPISNYWKNRLINIGCDENKICVQHMGIDCNDFEFTNKPLRKNKDIHLVSIARLTEKKGLEYSIKAVCNILKQRQDIFYQIIGDGPLRQELQTLINTLGCQNHINLVGWKNRDEVIKILKKSNLLIAPSVTASDGDMEGIPMVLMEAMAMGIPVISTFHSGIPELIEDGKTGFLVPERNTKALLEKIDYVTQTPESIATVTNNARQFVELHYNVDKQNDKLLKNYEKL